LYSPDLSYLYSDRKLNDLAKDIKSVLSPTSYTGEAAKSASQILTNSSITRAIEKVAERVNYGVTLDEAIAYAANKSLETPDEVPSSLQIWRWEVRDVEHIGSETREFAHARKQERKQARAELDVLLREKPETLAWEKNKPKVKSKDEEAASTSAIKAAESIPEIASKPAKEDVIVIDDDEEDSNAGFVTPSPTKRPVGSAHKESAGSNGSSSRNDSPVKAKKVTKKAGMSPDQLAKEAEKEEKKRIREAKKAEKAAKDAEKEAKKQIEAAKKQREDAKKQREANFFSKFVHPRPRSASPVKAERKDVPTISDFEKVFQACTYKDLAPINQFAGKCSGSTLSADKINSKEDLLADFNSGCRTRHTKRPRKGVNPPISVRDSMRLITEASVMGDEKLEENGKQGLANLSDRRKVPMKLLHFASDRRPAWYGKSLAITTIESC
jgi:chromatin assembly factor 1 subunit A